MTETDKLNATGNMFLAIGCIIFISIIAGLCLFAIIF
jgi:hypothetical protein